MTEIEAKTHYEKDGKNENRKYKYENIPEDYIELNEDLKHMTETEAETHYEKYGKNECRKYNKNIIYNEKINDTFIILDTNKQSNINNKIVIDNLDNYNNLILIIDYLYETGGTNTFLNSIINKYKISENLLIVKPNSTNNVSFSINNEFFMNTDYDEIESIIFLKQNSEKIIKIFINHSFGHNKNFMSCVCELEKPITYITHDYFYLSDNAQPLYEEIYIKKNINYDIINKINVIVSQNYYTLRNFLPVLNSNTTKIISPLPDYRNSDEKIETNNSEIVVGILGNISEIKGKYIIKQIIDNCKTTKIKFVAFGNLQITNFNNSYNYENINVFNKLLKIHKPNVLLEASIWPETYSYTLTLSKITKLPILYFNKNFPSVIVDRLRDYSESYSFTTIKECLDLIINKKQDFFYTVEPTIYFPKFWDEYFIILKDNFKMYKPIVDVNFKNIVFISSKLVLSKNKYTYNDKRSVYTFTQLYEQTINTINTIRKYIPNSFIILFDNSILKDEYVSNINNLTDVFINITDNKLLYR